MTDDTDIKSIGGHPARSPKFRRDTGYISDRNKYYSDYYQKNKEKIKAKKKKRYAESEAVRDYHRRKSNDYYQRNKVKTGSSNRTIMTTDSGERVYSIRHAANAMGFSVTYFRDLIKRGIIPDASIKNAGGWRMYTGGQIRLLKRAMTYYHQYTNPDRVQAVLFCFWHEPEAAMAMSQDQCLLYAMKEMKKRTNKKKIGLKM
jgi:hypothetical protein